MKMPPLLLLSGWIFRTKQPINNRPTLPVVQNSIQIYSIVKQPVFMQMQHRSYDLSQIDFPHLCSHLSKLEQHTF